MVSRTELLGSDLRKGSRQSEGGAEVGLGVPSEKLNQLVGSGVRMSLRRGQTWGWGVRRSPREASVPCGQFRDPDHNLQMAGQVGEGVNLSPHFPIPPPTHTQLLYTCEFCPRSCLRLQCPDLRWEMFRSNECNPGHPPLLKTEPPGTRIIGRKTSRRTRTRAEGS